MVKASLRLAEDGREPGRVILVVLCTVLVTGRVADCQRRWTANVFCATENSCMPNTGLSNK